MTKPRPLVIDVPYAHIEEAISCSRLGPVHHVTALASFISAHDPKKLTRMSSSPLTATLAGSKTKPGGSGLRRNHNGVLAEAGGLTAAEAREAALDFLAAQGHQDPEIGVAILAGHYLRACGRVRGYRYNALLKSKLEDSEPWLPAFIQTRSAAETAAIAEATQETRRVMQRLREALRTLVLPPLNDEGARARPTARGRHMRRHVSRPPRGAARPPQNPQHNGLTRWGGIDGALSHARGEVGLLYERGNVSAATRREASRPRAESGPDTGDHARQGLAATTYRPEQR